MIPESVQVDGLDLEVRRSPRRRTFELMVDRNGAVRIYAPHEARSDELARWVKRKLLWLHGKLAAKTDLSSKAGHPEFVSGETFSYLGRSYRLQVLQEQETPLKFDGARFLLRRDSRPDAIEHFRRWYRQVGTAWLQSRVKLLGSRVGTAPAEIKVRDLGFRWASCSRTGAVSFHWKLLQLPVQLVDYIIIHELIHLGLPHHDAEFWACVDRALPDWQERKAQLAECATRYLRFGT
jgi:predicted metal-dependent hydrolase